MRKHRTVPEPEIALATDRPHVSVGMSPASMRGDPRTELSGLRLKLPHRPEIYLVAPNGYRRWIPNPTTYNNLFRDWSGIVDDVDLFDIPEAAAIASGAVLARATGTATVYLVDGGLRHGITSSAVMDKYNFNWGTVVEVPAVLLDSIDLGDTWS